MPHFYIQSRYVDGTLVHLGSTAYTNLDDACHASSYDDDDAYIIEVEIDEEVLVARTDNLVTLGKSIDLERTEFTLYNAAGYREHFVYFVVGQRQWVYEGTTGYTRFDFAASAAKRRKMRGDTIFIVGIYDKDLPEMRNVNAFVTVNVQSVDLEDPRIGIVWFNY